MSTLHYAEFDNESATDSTDVVFSDDVERLLAHTKTEVPIISNEMLT